MLASLGQLRTDAAMNKDAPGKVNEQFESKSQADSADPIAPMPAVDPLFPRIDGPPVHPA